MDMTIEIENIVWDISNPDDVPEEIVEIPELPDHVTINTDHEIEDIGKYLEEEYDCKVKSFEIAERIVNFEE